MTTDAAAKTEKLLATLWVRNLPVIRERLHLLDRVAQAWGSAPLTHSARRDASSIAHKLAGSLGMFGYTEGTHIARKLELIFDDPADPDPDHLLALNHQLRQTLNLL